MLILIPLGGLGNRFKKLGYKLPKPLINVMGKPIIFWLLDNLKISQSDIILIPYNKELYKYRFEDQLLQKYPEYKFIFLKLEYDTEGACETLLLMLNSIKNYIEDQPVLCLDGDNFYLCDILNKWDKTNQIFTFKDISNEPIYSYILINKFYEVLDIKEKVKISDNACSGAYGFSSYKNLLISCEFIVKNNIRQKDEFYISNVISEMIKNNKFTSKVIDSSSYVCLGTPLQVRLFCNNYPIKNAFNNILTIKKQRYCFDLDNTLVTFPKKNGDYSTVDPIEKNINFLRYLKKIGHEIIIYTARNMRSNSGNVGKCMNKIGKITFDTLEKFNIPFDEIYFGKPYADFYIDDLAIPCFDDLEKDLGFYQSKIEPRSFNNLDHSSIQIFKKSSDKMLDGEIYYYNNIPKELKDLFPIMFNYDINIYNWYELERINGVPVTDLYLSQELSFDLLSNILNSIHRLHSTPIQKEENIDIYENYVKKIKDRYTSYDYSSYPESKKIYDFLIEELKKYKENNNAKIGIIHGDPVLTNILINQFGKIKFIDMKGKIGDNLTIYGDIFYDYAKILQSLIGYDEILTDKSLNLQYKDKIINKFIEIFLNIYNQNQLNNVKLITKSLLFSLIPLHDDKKCIEYFDLINSKYLEV